MSINGRLQKAASELSPQQRAALAAQAMREGRRCGPLLRVDDPAERHVFNRYLALHWAANYHLGAVAEMVLGGAAAAEGAAYHYRLLNEAAGVLEAQSGGGPSKPVRHWRRHPDLPVPRVLRGVALEARAQGTPGLLLNWRSLLALDAVASEVAAEFGLDSVLLPPVQERLDGAYARLREAAAGLGLKRLPSVAEPEDVDEYRQMVSAAFEKLGLVEPNA